MAVSFNIGFRPTNVFNFAQGDFVMVGALVGAAANIGGPVRWFIPLLAAVAVVGALGLVVAKVAIEPVLARGRGAIAWIISTIAILMVIENLVTQIWGAQTRSIRVPPGLTTATHDLAGALVSSYQIAVILGTVAIVAIVGLLYRTKAGRATLAVAEDREAAELQGIDPRRIGVWSFGMAGAFAALAGVIAAPLLFASSSLGPTLLLYGFEAAAVGGVGSNRGALLAGYLLGLTGSVASYFLAPGYADSLTFGLLLVVLLARPHGLFGRSEPRYV